MAEALVQHRTIPRCTHPNSKRPYITPTLGACPTVDPGRPPSVGAGGGPSSTNGGGRMDLGVLGMAVQHSPIADHLGMTAWYVLARSSP